MIKIETQERTTTISVRGAFAEVMNEAANIVGNLYAEIRVDLGDNAAEMFKEHCMSGEIFKIIDANYEEIARYAMEQKKAHDDTQPDNTTKEGEDNAESHA